MTALLSRRTFLSQLALGAGVALLPVPGLRAWAGGGPGVPPGPTGADGHRLVVVLLRGALDGLHAVPPINDPNYAELRPTLALGPPGTAGGALALPGESRFGLHPALAPLLPLWQDQRLAIVHATGWPTESRSHFEVQDLLETGVERPGAAPDGWLQRWLAVVGGASGPGAPSTPAPAPAPTPASIRDATEAVAVVAASPKILSGPRPVARLATGAAALRPRPVDDAGRMAPFAAQFAADPQLAPLWAEARASRAQLLAELVPHEAQADNGAPLPDGFAADAARIARLLNTDAGVRVLFTDLGGWDTHVNQGATDGTLPKRLGQLGDGLARLAADLGPRLDRTTIVVVSEFGRTARQNGNNGTDHGHGNVALVLGGGVRGGRVHADWPGLAPEALHENRDLAITTDLRAVFAAVARARFGFSPAQVAQVFPGYADAPAPALAGLYA